MIKFDDYIDGGSNTILTDYKLPEKIDEISIELDQGRVNIKINGIALPAFSEAGDYRDCLIKICSDK